MIPEKLRVRIYGDTAILNGHLITKRQVKGETVTREAVFTKVFLKRNGQWIMVNNQGTLVGQSQSN